MAQKVVGGGRYTLLNQIGRGGMGNVYLALDNKIKNNWAVKEIRLDNEHAQRELVTKSLINEANLIKDLDNPAIPRIHDLFEQNGLIYVVMDYVPGRTMNALIKENGALDEDAVVDWTLQLCDVLDYLHHRTPPIVYRDMKPGNVMITPDGSARLIDYGIAIETEPAPRGRALYGDPRALGSPGFAPPEQLDGHPHVDARSDIYALGATMFNALTGLKPAERNVKRDMSHIRALRPELSEGLEEIVATATQRNPDDRYQDCAAMAYALHHYKENDEAHRAVFRRRWRTFIALCTAAAACLAASGICLALRNSGRVADYQAEIAQVSDPLSKYVEDRQMANQDGLSTSERQQLESSAAQSLQTAEDHLSAAMDVDPSSTEPYTTFIDACRSLGQFTEAEETFLSDSINRHRTALQEDAAQWAYLSYRIGQLYWDYYTPQGSTDSGSLSNTRIRRAATWMSTAAAGPDDGLYDISMAKVYDGIARFISQIVSDVRGNSSDQDYREQFNNLRQIVENGFNVGDPTNPADAAHRLNAANLALDSLRVYPRGFLHALTANGMTQDDAVQTMKDLAARALELADTVPDLEGTFDKGIRDLYGLDEDAARIEESRNSVYDEINNAAGATTEEGK